MRVLVLASVLFVFADVAPRCGKREPRIAPAGEACGGPFTCAGGTTCMTLDQSIKTPSWETAYICTKVCATDADCAGTGSLAKCNATAHTRSSSGPSERVCTPAGAVVPPVPATSRGASGDAGKEASGP